MTSTDYDTLLQASHEDGIQRVGLEVGTPIISVNGASFFGPVVTPMPKGEAAARLWDGVVLVTGTDGFFELNLSPWDVAAGGILVREAGGVVTDWDGDERRWLETGNILAGSPPVHAALLEIASS